MLHYDPQHISSSTLLILRRTNCITTASGIVTLCKQPYNPLSTCIVRVVRHTCDDVVIVLSFETYSNVKNK